MLWGDGTGHFAPARKFVLNGYVAVGDFNGGGKAGLATSAPGGAGVLFQQSR